MYMLWTVVVNGNWVGTVTAPSYGDAIIDATYKFGRDARPVLAVCADNKNMPK